MSGLSNVASKLGHTPGISTRYTCKTCGWIGIVNGRPRCLQCYRERVRRWRAENPEQRRAQRRRADTKLRRELPAEYNRKRRIRRSKDRMREAWERRKVWLSQGDVTRQQLIEIYERDQGRCLYCGNEPSCVRFTPSDPRGFDHVAPRISGGKHTADNIVVCCKDCNAKKSGAAT